MKDKTFDKITAVCKTTVKSDFCNTFGCGEQHFFGMFNTDIIINSALINAEQHLMGINGILKTI